jgi:hypothetical protein
VRKAASYSEILLEIKEVTSLEHLRLAEFSGE